MAFQHDLLSLLYFYKNFNKFYVLRMIRSLSYPVTLLFINIKISYVEKNFFVVICERITTFFFVDLYIVLLFVILNLNYFI